MAVRDALRQKVSSVLSLDKEIARLRKDSDAALAAVTKQGNKLSESRRKSFPHFEKQLGYCWPIWACPTPASWCSTAPARPATSGIDVVSILFTANKGRAAPNAEQGRLGRRVLAPDAVHQVHAGR